ncbi:MAG: undecaprenyl-diphosphatase UppP [Patescibacteria group bacterium UBA2163]
MIDFFQFITLGVVQGLTEFIPVSSTGHLILARSVLGINPEYGLAVDAVLHLATALAVLVYFRKDIARLIRTFFVFFTGGVVAREDKILMFALMLGSIPVVIGGLFFKDYIEHVLRGPAFVAYGLIAGSVLFFVAERFATQAKKLSVSSGFVIGLFQALALIPGMSRSGATISGGLLLGLSREKAARFSFLLAFPVIVGAGAVQFIGLSGSDMFAAQSSALFTGAIAAFVSGLAAIHFLITFLRHHSLNVFIVYRLILALIILGIIWF